MYSIHAARKSPCRTQLYYILDQSHSLRERARIMLSLEKFCVFQERCAYDVRLKLLRMGVDKKDWDELIRALEHHGFLNEERFTELFVRSKSGYRAWGPLKIKAELHRRQIPEELIEKHLGQVGDDNLEERLKIVLKKKLAGIWKEIPQKQKEKLIRFGLSKGYPSGMVYRVVHQLTGLHEGE